MYMFGYEYLALVAIENAVNERRRRNMRCDQHRAGAGASEAL